MEGLDRYPCLLGASPCSSGHHNVNYRGYNKLYPMDKQKQEHFNELLIKEKERIGQELAALGSKNPNAPDAEYPESGSNSEDDNAAEVTEFVDMLSVEARLEAELKDVEKALVAIEKGTYGICKYCVQEIDEKRLEARPASSSCIACKKVLTQEM